MKIVAAADHGGFEMKNQIVENLRKQGGFGDKFGRLG